MLDSFHIKVVEINLKFEFNKHSWNVFMVLIL